MADLPLEAIQALLEPIDAERNWPTIGPFRLRIPPALAAAAKSTGSWSTLERLHTLTGLDNTLTFLGALVGFLSDKEIIIILGRWADQDPAAATLEQFGQGTWGHPGLASSLRPFRADQKASVRLHGSLTPQYLASMAAARRPVQRPVLADFVQRLRTLCLVRSFSALDKHQIYRESALQQVCMVLRRACDHPIDDSLTWLESILSSETHLDELASDLQLRCAAETKNAAASKLQKNFYRQLSIVAAGGPWRAVKQTMPLSDLVLNSPPGQLGTPASETTLSAAPLTDLIRPTSFDGTADTFVEFPCDPKNTAARNESHGKGLILEHQEHVQFLRQTWHHLSVEEEAALFQRIGTLLDSDNQVERSGATMTLIACITGRTMSTVDHLPVNTCLSDDWALDPKTQELKRRPPRFERRWRADSKGHDSLHWLQPMLDQLCIRLCDRAAQELTALLEKSDAQDLGSLWRSISPDVNLDAWFRDRFLKDSTLVNLSSPCTAKVLQIGAYNHCFNHAFVRLIGSQARTALPSACAYGAYNATDFNSAYKIDAAAGLFTMVEPSTDIRLNCGGSELDVLPLRIQDTIHNLICRVNVACSDPNRWVDAHNLLTSLCVISLFASTGARPVRSPFESLSAFDTDLNVVLVEDKVAGPTRGTRLCILSDFARDVICRLYLPHLASFAEFLDPTTPSFAGHLRAILERDPEAQVPLFFFLRDDPNLDWIEINETNLSLESGLSWPLPWNVFRHLHATELVHRGVDQEVVDALLAHADGIAQSHGCYSARIPIDDLASARTPINEMQRLWGFDASKLVGTSHPPRLLSVKEPRLIASRPFGRAARAQARDSNKAAARERARAEIDLVIGTRPPASLSPEEWHQIALKMLFREDQVRHNFASLRYEEFERYLSSIWQKQRKLIRIKRGFSISPPPDPWFKEEVIGVSAKLSALTADFERAQQALNTHRPSARSAATLATIELILHCGVTHTKALIDVLCLRPSVKLVKFQGAYWLEHSYNERWTDGRPVFRTQLTVRAAKWLAISTQAVNQPKVIPNVPPELEVLSPRLAGQSLKRLIDHLADLRHQLNALTLPGTDAAYLRGSLVFSALPHCDWYRLHTGTAPNYTPFLATQESDTEQEALGEAVFVLGPKPAALQGQSNPEKCAELFESIRDTISQNTSHPNRAVAAIRAAVSKSDYGRGDIPYALASFVCHLLTRPSKTGPRNNLRMSTVQRRWYALFQPICDLAHDKHIMDMECEDFTELYGEIVDWWDKHFDALPPSTGKASNRAQTGNSSNERLTPEERAADASRRTLNAIREFHQYIEIAFGAEAPEWSEISDEAAGVVGKPGFILLGEYLQGIQSLIGGHALFDLDEAELRNCFVWLLCGRFGLRLGEAVGLYRNDWVEAANAIVVAVQANHVRPLKTPQSRRKVPLVEPITQEERQVIEEVLRRWLIDGNRKPETPLVLGVSKDTFRSIRSAIGVTLGTLVKSVTCNQTATFHMLRHSYASRMNSLLRGQPLGKFDGFCLSTSRHAQRLLLGKNRTDRRMMWSIARLLGHAGPSVTARCYLHGLEQWLPRPVEIEQTAQARFVRAELIDLDALEPVDAYGTMPQTAEAVGPKAKPDLARLLIFLRLRVQGHSRNSAAWHSLVDSVAVEIFDGLLSGAATKTGLADSDSFEIVRSIPLDRWKVIVQRSRDASVEHMEQLKFEALETIGRRRQVLLFREAHFKEFSTFVAEMKIDPSDICLVESRNLNAKLVNWKNESNLSGFVKLTSHFGPTFQLDKVEFGDPPSIQKDRVVAVPTRSGGSLHTTQNVLTLWLSWLAVRSANSVQAH